MFSGIKSVWLGLIAMLSCALFFSGCSALNSGTPSRAHNRPKADLQTAVALGVAALSEYRDINEWAGRYELEIKRREDHWTLRFLFLPASPGGETSLLVYDTREVLIIGGM